MVLWQENESYRQDGGERDNETGIKRKTEWGGGVLEEEYQSD